MGEIRRQRGFDGHGPGRAVEGRDGAGAGLPPAVVKVIVLPTSRFAAEARVTWVAPSAAAVDTVVAAGVRMYCRASDGDQGQRGGAADLREIEIAASADFLAEVEQDGRRRAACLGGERRRRAVRLQQGLRVGDVAAAFGLDRVHVRRRWAENVGLPSGRVQTRCAVGVEAGRRRLTRGGDERGGDGGEDSDGGPSAKQRRSRSSESFQFDCLFLPVEWRDRWGRYARAAPWCGRTGKTRGPSGIEEQGFVRIRTQARSGRPGVGRAASPELALTWT